MIKKWIFIHRRNELDKNKFTPVTNDFIKPDGGLWIAPYTENCEFSSAWEEFLINDIGLNTKGYKGTIVSIKPNAVIVIVDSVQDLINILENYSYTHPILSARFIDFEKLSKDYDAIYLTEKGQYETRLSDPNLYGWDIESMLVMNFDIIEEESVITL